MLILSIDAGTTGVTAQLANQSGVAVSRGYSEFEQHFPQPGWVEHQPEQIWQATLVAVRAALASGNSGAGFEAAVVKAIGITNQRETVAVWDRQSLESPCPAIVWQDRRTADILSDAKFAESGERVRQASGLPLDAYFSSSKFLWIKRNLPGVWAEVESGRFALGTIDAYLLARITGGAVHATDASNASRTQLMNIHTLQWDAELCDLFEVPVSALPQIRPNVGDFGDSAAHEFLGISAPVTGMAGDQQAALFGQLAFEVGDAKCTYGTGAFLLQNTGDTPQLGDEHLLATVAWVDDAGVATYAFEGSVFVAGAAVQWLRDGLKMISSADELESLADSVSDNGGVYFVPALAGLGAPFWDPEVRGSFLGITRGTERGHFARATYEALAFQVRALIDAFKAAGGPGLCELRTDGGAAASALLLQTQADVLGIPVNRPANLDTTGLGAAFLAGIGAGVWANQKQLVAALQSNSSGDAGASFRPAARMEVQYGVWLRAVTATRSW
jgi:glycerol kinase